MDPITQGAVGLTASQLIASRTQKGIAAVFGMLSGMSADLDVLIRSSNDPLLALEYHRHFTHSLVFIPVGALICAIVLRALLQKLRREWFVNQQVSFKQIYLYCFAGYASHAVLDACTTYGTQLLWPFSDMRVAWNNVSVVDPLFTLPLMLLIGLSLSKRSRSMAVIATAFALLYLGLGNVQKHRAEIVAQQLAQSRGHQPISIGVKPSFANIIVWKSVYEYDGKYHIDAVRVLADNKIYAGGSIQKLNTKADFPWLDPSSQQAKDIERFRWFSNNHLAIDPRDSNRIIDVRYSLVPNEYEGMWGIKLQANQDNNAHVLYTTDRPEGDLLNQAVATLWAMVLGR